MRHENNILSRLLPIGAIQLGWLVLDQREPLKGYYKDSAAPQTEIETVKLEGFKKVLEVESNAEAGLSFTKLLSTRLFRNDEMSLGITAAEAFVSSLKNTTSWFGKTCRSEQAREWFEEQAALTDNFNPRLYFVIGLHIIKGATVVASESKRSAAEGKFTVAPELAVGTPISTQGIFDIQAKGSTESSRSVNESFNLEDEGLIYAVEYRRVKFKLFTSKKVETSMLADRQCWKVLMVQRGEEPEDLEFIEAMLTNEMDKDILEEGSENIICHEDHGEVYSFRV